jgi:hypothetical protein
VLDTVEREVLVHLVRDDDQVVLECDVGDELELLAAEDLARRIVRCVDEQQLRLRRDRRAQLVGSNPYAGGRSVTGRLTAPASATQAW